VDRPECNYHQDKHVQRALEKVGLTDSHVEVRC
jgi:hypothetical protein